MIQKVIAFGDGKAQMKKENTQHGTWHLNVSTPVTLLIILKMPANSVFFTQCVAHNVQVNCNCGLAAIC